VFLSVPNPIMMEIMHREELDFAVVDNEHATMIGSGLHPETHGSFSRCNLGGTGSFKGRMSKGTKGISSNILFVGYGVDKTSDLT
jgi:hypothetical protein